MLLLAQVVLTTALVRHLPLRLVTSFFRRVNLGVSTFTIIMLNLQMIVMNYLIFIVIFVFDVRPCMVDCHVLFMVYVLDILLIVLVVDVMLVMLVANILVNVLMVDVMLGMMIVRILFMMLVVHVLFIMLRTHILFTMLDILTTCLLSVVSPILLL